MKITVIIKRGTYGWCAKTIGLPNNTEATCFESQDEAKECFNSILKEEFPNSEIEWIIEDLVKRPSHYGGYANPFEPIKIIQWYKLNFNIGNVIKYALRKKGRSRIDDLKKIQQYCQFEIDEINK